MERMKLWMLTTILTIGSCCGQATAQGGLMNFIKKVGTRIDSMSVSGVDRSYIDAPERPWQIIARGNVSQTIVSMKASGNLSGIDYSAKPYMKTDLTTYAGFWVGYRGYGLGYTVNVGGDKGSLLTLGAMGGAYGINIRIHAFENSSPYFNLESDMINEEDKDTWNKMELISPIHVNTFMADGYYLFNGKKFSYAAAYDQSVIQKRSAGSLMAGLMYNYTYIDYATDSNADLIYLMDGLGRAKTWQGSIGVGYAYNWVPARGLLINLMAMPMLTVINKLKVYGYQTNVPELMEEPWFLSEDISNEEWDNKFYSNVHITPAGEHTFNSGLSLGYDARVSLSYNIGRYFLCVYGQFNNIRYRHNNTTGYIDDWFINTSFGLRL